jgi:hypothetical protein
MKTKRNYTIMDSGEVFYDDTRETDTAPPPPYLGFRARMTWYLLQDEHLNMRSQSRMKKNVGCFRVTKKRTCKNYSTDF